MRTHWQRVNEMLRKQYSNDVPETEAAPNDVMAFLLFPQDHWRKFWCTNPLERLYVAPLSTPGSAVIKRLPNLVGIFPNDAANVRLVGCQLQEQQEEWQLESRRFFSEATMAKIPQPEELLDLTDSVPSEQKLATIC